MHDQVAHESRHNGSIRGNFTVALLELIKEAGLTITYNELYLVYQSEFTGIAMVLNPSNLSQAASSLRRL